MLEGIGRFDHAYHGFCIVELCQGKLCNKDFYAFVAIEPQNYSYFKQHYKKGRESDFEAYGKELLRGWGPTPPHDIVEYLRNKYNIEFSVEQPFLERLVALTKESPFPLKPATASGT